MKTFKLKMLEIVDYDAEQYETKKIPLIDGLIINREDKNNNWLIEAYMEHEFESFFKELETKHEELILHVKITTELNDKATCLTRILSINKIGEKMNVLFLGNMIDQRTPQLEAYLEELIIEGNQGEELLEKFKEKIL